MRDMWPREPGFGADWGNCGAVNKQGRSLQTGTELNGASVKTTLWYSMRQF